MPVVRPNHPAVERLVADANTMLQRGDAQSGRRLAFEALAIKKDHPGAIRAAAGALNMLKRHAEARELLARLGRAVQADAGLLFESAFAELHLGGPDEALTRFNAVRTLSPDFPGLETQIGISHAVAGRHARAVEILTPVVQATGSRVATLRLSTSLRQMGRAAEAVDLLSRALQDESCPRPERRALLYARAEAHDALREFDRAWRDLISAGELAETAGYDPDLVTAAVDAAIAAWSPEIIRAMPLSPLRADRAIFVLGMWRSGTTLVEQILASHPRIAGAGELFHFLDLAAEAWPDSRIGGVPFPGSPASLKPAQVQATANAHARSLRSVSMDATRVIDKHPLNAMYLGVISRVCPGARVVRCNRDALDTCISCLFQMRGHAAPYCARPEWLGRFYRDAARLTDHFASVAGLSMHAVRYEDLVVDLRAHALALAEFAGVPWDERMSAPERNSRVAMTRSIDQVRKPVYTSSIGRWKAYERHLGPLIDALGPMAGA